VVFFHGAEVVLYAPFFGVPIAVYKLHHVRATGKISGWGD